MVDRGELAAFLRDRRARIGPGDAGLPETGRRRTPGLRRQEVAQLAGMSVEYYVRLEQARGPNPSRQVLSALSRALMLNVDERAYLFRIADAEPPATRGVNREITPAVHYLLNGLTTTPAYVLDAKYDVLAWNRMATYFIGDMTALPEDRRNIIEWMFSQPDDAPHWDDPNTDCFTRHSVADLRATYARYPGDPDIARLVTTLLGTSPRFTRMWESREVRERRGFSKRVEHPLVGTLEFECQILSVPDNDQQVMMYCPEPGSPTERAMERLAAEFPAPSPEHVPPLSRPLGPVPRGPGGPVGAPPPSVEADTR
ncbi:helix-turn-helix transcriptional regulator [Nocardiopsis quinghaiensis]|uniref:helix-turn-helix transcriptional regulator n=1 Tax=Nocardiopsis quinghaiensis TaxID=464995 RepID=UPI00123B6790|nr:helix-turn-helix transcriptional regulator [Nocardiopsis quinghaiensis]